MSAMSDKSSVLVIPDTLQVTGTMRTPDQVSIQKGPMQKIIIEYESQTATDQGFTFDNIIPASESDVMDRKLVVSYDVYVKVGVLDAEVATLIGPPAFQLAAPGSVFQQQSGSDGLYLRSMPLNQVTVNGTLKINGVATSIPSQDLATLHGPTVDPKFSRFSEAATYPFGYDVGARYDFLQTSGVGRKAIVDSQSNAFSTVQTDKESDVYQPRGMSVVNCVQVVAPAADGANNRSAVYKFSIEEDFVIPPYVFGNADAQDGITRVQNLSLLLTFGDLRRMVAVLDAYIPNMSDPLATGANNPPVYSITTAAAAGGASAITQINGAAVAGAGATYTVHGPVKKCLASRLTVLDVSFTKYTMGVNVTAVPAKPKLRITYSTPDPIMATKIAPFVTYPYTSFAQYIETIGANTAGASTGSKTCNAIRLVNVPDKIVIGVRPSNASLVTFTPATALPGGDNCLTGAQLTNHWLPIRKMSLIYNTRSGIFATYTDKDIWKMSRRNGLKLTYHEWLSGGGPVIIDTAFDIGVDAREASGQAINVTIQFSIDWDYDNPWKSSYKGAAAAVAAQGFTTVNYEVFTLAMTPAQCSIGAGTSVFAVQGPSQTQVLNLLSDGTSGDFMAKTQVPADDDGVKNGGLSGGSFFGKLAGHIRGAANFARRAIEDNPELVHQGIKMVGKHLFGGDVSAGDLQDGMGGGISAGGMRKHPRAR